MNDIPENGARDTPGSSPKYARGESPNSQANLRRGSESGKPAVLSEDSQGMLEAMRHVVTTPPSRDTTYEQREYRRWLKQDRKGFMTKKADLERAALGAREPGKGPDE